MLHRTCFLIAAAALLNAAAGCDFSGVAAADGNLDKPTAAAQTARDGNSPEKPAKNSQGEAASPRVEGASGAEFHAQLLDIAATYEKLGRFDERLRFGPSLCRGPLQSKPEPSRVRLSKSGDDETHGKKLYYLYVKDQIRYGSLRKTQEVGQVIVKEAWKPEAAKDERGVTVAYDRDDEQHYRAGEKIGLFIMTKLAPDTPNTDEGWVYGTVSADGKKITSAGRVENCMACHKSDKTKDRMFGVDMSEAGDGKR
ncbi:MAG: cytochrome P460 family protein [Pirellulales bacterium]